MGHGFLLDMGISPKVALALQKKGLQAVHAKDVGLAHATDLEILAEARKRDWVVVTSDNDFASHVVLERASSPSIITLRLANPSAEEQVEAMKRILENVSLSDMDHCLLTLDQRRLRRRNIPIVE